MARVGQIGQMPSNPRLRKVEEFGGLLYVPKRRNCARRVETIFGRIMICFGGFCSDKSVLAGAIAIWL